MCLFDYYKGPWLICGDLNDILTSTEKCGDRPIIIVELIGLLRALTILSVS